MIDYRRGAEHVQIEWLHRELSEDSYWAKGRSEAEVRQIVDCCYCYSGFDGEQQVAFARVLSDRVSLAYLGDVWVAKAFRGRGIGKELVGMILSDPLFGSVKKWLLATQDAHSFYRQLGFDEPLYPDRIMELRREPSRFQAG